MTIKTADVEPRANADSAGDWTPAVDLRRGGNQFEVSAADPETGKVAEEPVDRFITVPFLRDPGADAHASTNQPRARRSRTARSRSRAATTNAGRSSVSAAYTGPDRAAARASARPRRRPPRPGAGRPCDGRRGRRVQHAVRADDGHWAITVTASSPEGKTTSLTRNVYGRVQGRQPGRDDRGRPGLDQGLGRRQDRRQDRVGRQGPRQRQDPDVHRQGVDRGPDRLVGRDQVHAQRHVARGARAKRRPRDVAVRAARRAGARPSAADERAADRRRARSSWPDASGRPAARAGGRSAPPSRAPAASSPISSPRSRARAGTSSAAS